MIHVLGVKCKYQVLINMCHIKSSHQFNFIKQESDEDEPPPLPAQPPPPVNWSTFPSAGGPPLGTPQFVDDTEDIETQLVEQPVSSPPLNSPAVTVVSPSRTVPIKVEQVPKPIMSSQDPTTRIRTDIMRKKSEFLGLNVEESNEYKTFTKGIDAFDHVSTSL